MIQAWMGGITVDPTMNTSVMPFMWAYFLTIIQWNFDCLKHGTLSFITNIVPLYISGNS